MRSSEDKHCSSRLRTRHGAARPVSFGSDGTSARPSRIFANPPVFVRGRCAPWRLCRPTQLRSGIRSEELREHRSGSRRAEGIAVVASFTVLAGRACEAASFRVCSNNALEQCAANGCGRE